MFGFIPNNIELYKLALIHKSASLVLEDGRIVGRGTHKELLQNCSTYREIAMSQLSEEELK